LSQAVIAGKVVKDYYYYSTGDVLQYWYYSKILSPLRNFQTQQNEKIILNTGNGGILLSIVFVLGSERYEASQ
jgi:hypothetical protein